MSVRVSRRHTKSYLISLAVKNGVGHVDILRRGKRRKEGLFTLAASPFLRREKENTGNGLEKMALKIERISLMLKKFNAITFALSVLRRLVSSHLTLIN